MTHSADRWAELKAFIAEWHRPLEPADGDTAEEIDAIEERIGHKLPDAVREWYQLAGRFAPINKRFKGITDSDSPVDATGNLLVISYLDCFDGEVGYLPDPDDPEPWDVSGCGQIDECPEVYRWVVLADDLDILDPPVYLDNSAGTYGDEQYYREGETFTEFAFKMAASITLYSSDSRPGLFLGVPLGDRVMTQLSERLVSVSRWSFCCSEYFWRGNGILLGTTNDGANFDLIARTEDQCCQIAGELSDLIGGW